MSLTSSGNSFIHFIWYLRINDFTVAPCNSPKRVNLFGDFSSSAQFFVFTGVFVFLYCIGVLILYVVYNDAYSSSDRASKAIFGFANIALWASSLWFIWKETSWSKRNDSLVETSNVSGADGSSI
ncbi:uncharacterized protein DEA37_0006188 [Paragonimus westermani]|uniref:MARVEL domain-containing protein n=1 Tax=Paragonimus westermani TaxID=34504 RepID=A0A5J4P569_9TREM|nr:uncharacterized protein DEA37_0006188 [Paragonimus westermani]